MNSSHYLTQENSKYEVQERLKETDTFTKLLPNHGDRCIGGNGCHVTGNDYNQVKMFQEQEGGLLCQELVMSTG